MADSSLKVCRGDEEEEYELPPQYDGHDDDQDDDYNQRESNHENVHSDDEEQDLSSENNHPHHNLPGLYVEGSSLEHKLLLEEEVDQDDTEVGDDSPLLQRHNNKVRDDSPLLAQEQNRVEDDSPRLPQKNLGGDLSSVPQQQNKMGNDSPRLPRRQVLLCLALALVVIAPVVVVLLIGIFGSSSSSSSANRGTETNDSDYKHEDVNYIPLKALFDSTRGPNWKNNNNWLQGKPCSNQQRWHGLECADSGVVVSLDLDGNGLNGTIPTEIGLLSSLQRVYFGRNSMYGLIPTELGQLSNIEILELSKNLFNGKVPKEIGKNSALTWMTLHNNSLTGTVPSEICQLAMFERLDHFEADCAGKFPNSVEIECPCCTRCYSDDMPGGEQKFLVDLSKSLKGNLTVISHTLVCRDYYERIQCDEAKSITYIRFNSSGVSGSIPSSIGLLSELRALDLSNNQISGTLPTEIGRLSKLISLRLQGNRISGNIPTQIGELKELTQLRLSNHQLTGNIPSHIGALDRLNEAFFELNKFDGTMPYEICRLRRESLSNLTSTCSFDCPCCTSCSENNTHPEDMAGLKAIYGSTGGSEWRKWENAHHNYPKWFEGDPCNDKWAGLSCNRAKRVVSLSLGNFGLRGYLPPGIGSLEMLTSLSLEENSLGGFLPREIGKLSQLSSLRLARNYLSGPIPREIGQLTGLREIDMSHNRLSRIVSEIGLLTNLASLDLFNNTILRGTLPMELVQLSRLSNLDIRLTSMTGEVPAEFCEMWDARFKTFSADCAGPTPEIECSCCQECYADHMPDEERSALVTLYENTKGDEWKTSSYYDEKYWDLPTEDPCELPGVECNVGKSVVGLYLELRGLKGSLPTELGLFSQLSSLDLSYNQLTGNIPSQLGEIKTLRRVNFKENFLQGRVPPTLGMVNLTFLDLSFNNLTSTMPAQICQLVEAEILKEIISDCGGQIPEVQCLCCTECYADVTPVQEQQALTALIDQTDVFRQLSYQGDPCLESWDFIECNNAKSVTKIFMSQYGGRSALSLLTRLPTELGFLSHLESLHISGAKNLHGTIPSEVGQLNRLTSLSLSDVGISGTLPVSIFSMSSLVSLQVSDALLSGTVPSTIGLLGSLTHLELYNMSMTGVIPTELGRLVNLTPLNLSSNSFSGQLPTEIGLLQELRYLNVSHNPISGQIPSELGLLGTDTEISLHQTDLNGTIPNTFCQGRAFDKVLADCVGDSPKVEKCFCCMCFAPETSVLEKQALHDLFSSLGGQGYRHRGRNWMQGDPCGNHWEGIVCSLGDKRVTKIDLRLFGLTGSLPTSIGYLTNLEYLYLSGSGILGSLPSEVGRLDRLRFLDLDWNHMTGELPTQLGQLTSLQRLEMRGNAFSGSIPSEIGRLSSLGELHLANNDLTGSMPREVCALTRQDAPSLSVLVVDCHRNDPKVECFCCTGCMG